MPMIDDAAALADLAVIRERVSHLTGQERVAQWHSGSLPLMPVMQLMGVRPFVADTEGSRTEMVLGPALLSASGRLPTGVLAVLADVVTGGAVGVAAGLARAFVTVTLSVEPVVRDLPTSGLLVARATVVETRGDLHFAEGTIHTGEGRYIARLAAWYVLTTARDRSGPADEDLAVTASVPPGAVGGVDPGPVGRLLGVRGIRVGEGTAEAVLPGSPRLMNMSLVLHGGVGALLTDLVSEAALGPGTGYRPIGATYSYLRATGAAGELVKVRARVLKPGGTIATVEAEVLTSQGKTALHAVVNASMGEV